MKTKSLFFGLLISLFFCLQGGTIKADTIYVQIPQASAQNLCVDINDFPTFVFYKPIGFGGTVWMKNGSYYGTGDSIVYTPISVGAFDFAAGWSGNVEGAYIVLFSGAPPHAEFSIDYQDSLAGNGIINAAADTLWKCVGSLHLLANANGLTMSSYAWYGLDGFITSNDNPISVTSPGTYYYYQYSPCDTTVDSIVVIQPATILPDLGLADTTFCNPPQGTTVLLNAGAGYSTIVWSTGETSPSITIDTTGTYTVNVTSVCPSGNGTVTKQIHYEVYPESDLWYQQVEPLCPASVMILNPSPGFTYQTYHWSTGATTPTLTISGLTTGSGIYRVTVTQGTCVSMATIEQFFIAAPTKPSLCIATVDAVTGKNKLVWEVSQPGIASYDIYQLTSDYTLIGNVPNVPGANILSYYDMVTNPMASAARYKIAAIDSACGTHSVQSFYHGTIKINSNANTTGGVDLTIVDHYIDESGTNNPTEYYILIDSLNNGSLHIFNTLNIAFNSFTVTQPIVGATYAMAVSLSACENTKSLLSNMSVSNKSSVITDVMAQPTAISTVIYPNPISNNLTIEAKNNSEKINFQIYNSQGQVVFTGILQDKTLVETTNFASGVYLIKLDNGKSIEYKKIVKE